MAKVLEFQLQHQSFQWIFRTDFLGLIGWISLQSNRLSRVFSNTSSKASIIQCSAFFIVQLSYPYMITGKTIPLNRQTFVGKVMSLLFNCAKGRGHSDEHTQSLPLGAFKPVAVTTGNPPISISYSHLTLQFLFLTPTSPEF